MTHEYPDINVLVVRSIKYNIQQLIALNYKECQLLTASSNVIECFRMACESVFRRTLVDPSSRDWKVDEYWIEGKKYIPYNAILERHRSD